MDKWWTVMDKWWTSDGQVMDSDGQDIYVKLRAGGIWTNFWDSLNVCRYPAKYRGRAPAASWCTGIHLFRYLHRNGTYACKWLQNVPHTKIHLSPLSDGVGRKTGYLGVLALSGESIAHVFSAPGRKLEPNGTLPWDFQFFGAKRHPLAQPGGSWILMKILRFSNKNYFFEFTWYLVIIVPNMKAGGHPEPSPRLVNRKNLIIH